MKLKSYHLLFRFFSYLSDKTNGFSLFARYKLILGTLIIGLTTSSCANKGSAEKPDENKKIDDNEQITCYEAVAPQPEEGDTTTVVEVPQPRIAPPPTIQPDCYEVVEPVVTCYDMAVIEDTIRPIPEPPKEMLFGTVDTAPVFPSGNGYLSDFMDWLHKTVRYPEGYGEICIQGRVTLKFIIDTDGNVVDITVIRGLDPKMDKEAIKAVAASPKWKPGSHNGQPVRVSVTVPVSFKL